MSPNASAQLAATMLSINAGLPSLAPLLGLNSAALTNLSLAATLNSFALSMGINLGAPGAAAQLQAAIAAQA